MAKMLGGSAGTVNTWCNFESLLPGGQHYSAGSRWERQDDSFLSVINLDRDIFFVEWEGECSLF
jgi:hypothetical protein